MENTELKKIIAEYLRQGVSLSEIQKRLDTEHGHKTTFMELRLLAAEIENINWEKLPGQKPPAAEPPRGDVEHIEDDEFRETEVPEDKTEWSQGTVVEISKLARPGAVLSGSVKFGSGASADWVLDQMGRLMFEKAKGKPTEQDIREFQIEIQRKIGGR